MPARKNPNAAVREFAFLLRRHRRKLHWNQKAMAETLGLSLRQYKRLEMGRCFPAPKTRNKIRAVLPHIFPEMLKKKNNEQARRLLRTR